MLNQEVIFTRFGSQRAFVFGRTYGNRRDGEPIYNVRITHGIGKGDLYFDVRQHELRPVRQDMAA